MGRSLGRGYTLLELMIVVAVSSILGTTFCTVMYYQVLTYMERLDEVDAHQSARASFNVIRRYVQGARYGMAQNANARGVVGIGRCMTSAGSGSTSTCTAQDGNNDRMRIMGIVPDLNFVGTSAFSSPGPCSAATSPVDVTRINVAQSANYVFATSPAQLLGIGGNCLDTNYAAGNDLLVYAGDSGSANGCTDRYTFGFWEGATQLACPTGYAKGFAFGAASVADFYVAPDSLNSNNTNLMLRTDPRVAQGSTVITNNNVVAYNVTTFNVTYLIDTTSPPDRGYDLRCRDPRATADGGSCIDPTGTLTTSQQIYNRIVGVEVTLAIRSNTFRPNLPGSVDGYRTWTYTSQFSLRNSAL